MVRLFASHYLIIRRKLADIAPQDVINQMQQLTAVENDLLKNNSVSTLLKRISVFPDHIQLGSPELFEINTEKQYLPGHFQY
jgi:hypothetical protein